MEKVSIWVMRWLHQFFVHTECCYLNPVLGLFVPLGYLLCSLCHFKIQRGEGRVCSGVNHGGWVRRCASWLPCQIIALFKLHPLKPLEGEPSRFLDPSWWDWLYISSFTGSGGSGIGFFVGGDTQTASCPQNPPESTIFIWSTRLDLAPPVPDWTLHFPPCNENPVLNISPLLWGPEALSGPCWSLRIRSLWPMGWATCKRFAVIVSHQLRHFCSCAPPQRANLLVYFQYSRWSSKFPFLFGVLATFSPKALAVRQEGCSEWRA